MSIGYEDFLQSARALQSGDDEVDWRNAASRAYYALYHACTLAAEQLSVTPSGRAGVHSELISTLRAPANPVPYKKLGHALGLCRDLRIKADYRIEQGFTAAQCQRAIRLCERAFSESATLLQRNPSTP